MSTSDSELEELRTRVERLEAQIAFLFRSLGITAQEAPEGRASDHVMALVRQGDTRGAIRAFREETGASLKDAKMAIESLRG